MERTRVLIHFVPSLLHLLPIFLYAETHYRFRYFFSFLRKREPEIIADAPHRLDPNTPLPVLILIKDAHRYPIDLSDISITIRSHGKIINSKSLLAAPLQVMEKLWWRIFEIPLDGANGKIECDVRFIITKDKKESTYYNDNYRTSSQHPLSVFVSSSSLPRVDHLYFGECHSHSSYTDDQVEFGAPLEASAILCKSFGLSFFCVTDHSYDLDDSADNYLINDAELPKWKTLQQEVELLNSKLKNFTIVRGEEVTCRNSENQNIHLLLLGNRKYFYGSGDSAEKWLRTWSENSIHDVLEKAETTSFAFAAHPMEDVSFLQRLLLHRGKWKKQDIEHPQLIGLQFANGNMTTGFWEGYHSWVNQLLQGKKVFTIAGNDAHGNFNRFRQIGIPFVRIREHNNQLFGKMRTGIFLDSLSEIHALRAIKSGMSIISDGPVMNLHVKSNENKSSSIGLKYQGNKHSISLEVHTSSEFGSIESIKMIKGNIGNQEIFLFRTGPLTDHVYSKEIILDVDTTCYIRGEIWTSSSDSVDNQSHFCMTNPIWFTPASPLR
jgi:hypothetical protein